ncbi:MAG: YkgJ family cysteine cluster protein [Thermodesulfovibrionales bacterium]|nr:YkgJ family cysteine cluster protein [Thermodesulfovibrionales bacterium]
MDEKLKIILPNMVEETTEKHKQVSYQKTCKRCGQCCRAASPLLLKTDYSLFISGHLTDTNTYTLRLGEPILNRLEQDVYFMPFEAIKIEDENNACHFYAGSGECLIYEDRPTQCQTYECWNNAPHQESLEEIRLTRQDIFGDIDPIIKVITKHDEVCSYETLIDLIQKLKEGDESSLTQIQQMIDYDIATREFLNENYGISPKGLHLVLGKPLYKKIELFGLQVIENEDGSLQIQIKETGNEDIS